MRTYRDLIVLLISIIFTCTATANDKTLIQFKPQGTLEVLQTELSQGIIGRYLIDIDLNILHQSSKFTPIRIDKLEWSASEEDFLLLPSGENLISKETIRLKSERYGQYVKGVNTFSGTVVGEESGSFTLSISDNQISGQVQTGHMLLKLAYDRQAGSHILTVIDLHLMPKDTREPDYNLDNVNPILFPNSVPSSSLPGEGIVSASSSSSNNGNIRILVYYTQKVAARNNVSALAANIISELNTSVDLSEISPDIDFIFAGMMALTSNLDGLCRDEIRELALDRLSPFQNLDSNLNTYSADVALIIATEESTTDPDYSKCNVYARPNYYLQRIGGIAGNILDSTQPFAITMDTYAMGDRTAIHEIGHVIGGNHEQESGLAVAPGTAIYARRYVSTSDSWQTIMGGYWGCPFVYLPSQPTCVRLNRWSNPSLTYQGEYTGVSDESDMRSALEVTAPIVADWTPYPAPAPTVAPSVTVTPEYCGGSNNLAWNAISGATHYQMFSNTTGLFERTYIGISTSLFVVVSPLASPEYFKVRACNGNGCGPFSSTKSASYFWGCLP